MNAGAFRFKLLYSKPVSYTPSAIQCHSVVSHAHGMRRKTVHAPAKDFATCWRCNGCGVWKFRTWEAPVEKEREERERERERARVMSCKGKLFSIYDDAYVYIYIHEQPSKRAITNLVKSGREFQELG